MAKGKALQVDSSTKEEVVAQLLSVEQVENPIEIVIHVNMLRKAGTLIISIRSCPCAPDFVIETESKKYLVEVKADNEMEDAEVLAKAETGKVFCENVTTHAQSYSGKPWAYALLADSQIGMNSSLKGLLEG